MDVFIEKIVARQKTGQDRLISAGIVIAGIILVFVLFNIPVLAGISPILVVGVFYRIYYFSKSRNIEYEYAVTNGDLDIDKIIAQRKRKRIFSSSCKEFEIVAKVQSQHFTRDMQNIQKKIEAVSSMASPNAYFVVLNYKGERTIVFFEPDQRMLDNFKTFIPRKVMND